MAEPRVVLVTRDTTYQGVLKRYGSAGQSNFRRAQSLQNAPGASYASVAVAMADAGEELSAFEVSSSNYVGSRREAVNAVPSSWQQVSVKRDELSRFPFDADDIVVVVGQDGLVANVAKYLNGQPVIGLNPEPGVNPGVLVPHDPSRAKELIRATADGNVDVEERTMVQCELEDGQKLVALNEVFIGHRSHQSARYSIEYKGYKERQSSSGVVVATGTGSTGWASSINAMAHSFPPQVIPTPTDRRLEYFVREAWSSPATGVGLVAGLIEEDDQLMVTSELNEDGVIFGDGIEEDRLEFRFGSLAVIGLADKHLRLVK